MGAEQGPVGAPHGASTMIQKTGFIPYAEAWSDVLALPAPQPGQGFLAAQCSLFPLALCPPLVWSPSAMATAAS